LTCDTLVAGTTQLGATQIVNGKLTVDGVGNPGAIELRQSVANATYGTIQYDATVNTLTMLNRDPASAAFGKVRIAASGAQSTDSLVLDVAQGSGGVVNPGNVLVNGSLKVASNGFFTLGKPNTVDTSATAPVASLSTGTLSPGGRLWDFESTGSAYNGPTQSAGAYMFTIRLQNAATAYTEFNTTTLVLYWTGGQIIPTGMGSLGYVAPLLVGRQVALSPTLTCPLYTGSSTQLQNFLLFSTSGTILTSTSNLYGRNENSNVWGQVIEVTRLA
jgi:hypothetical protein